MLDEPAGQRNEDGFTLIELIVVIGVIAVLIVIMIPTLLQARVPAQDRQAQNLLRNSLTAAKAVETSDGVMADPTNLTTEEPGVAFVASRTTAPANQRRVSVAQVSDGTYNYVVLASHSASGRCFALIEQAYRPTRFQRIDHATTGQADQFDATTGWLEAWP